MATVAAAAAAAAETLLRWDGGMSKKKVEVSAWGGGVGESVVGSPNGPGRLVGGLV